MALSESNRGVVDFDDYREIVCSADAAIFSVDADGRIRQWNRAAERLYGYSEDEIIGEPIDVLIPREHRREWDQIFEAVRRGESLHHLATVRRNKEGRNLWTGVTVCPLRLRDDSVGATLFSRGLTAKMQEDERFRQAVESAPNAMLLVDAAGAITMANQEAERLFGYTASELIGRPVEVLVPPSARAPHESFRSEYLKSAAKRGMGMGRNLAAVRKDGSLVPVEIGLNPVGQKPRQSILASIVDISERVEAEALQARLNQSLKDAVAARDLFLSVASHELKTPIATLQLSLQAVQQGLADGGDAKMTRRLTSCERQVKRLAELVEQLLDLSRLQSGDFGLEREELDLGELALEIAERFLSAGVSTKIEVDSEPGVIGLWDRSRIDQALVNLVSNALKYGQGSDTRIEVRRRGDTASLGVRDRGKGIPASEHQKIFQKFARVDGTDSRGFGLGLWLTRSYIEAHGGAIRVESELGRGSFFEILLPIKKGYEHGHTD